MEMYMYDDDYFCAFSIISILSVLPSQFLKFQHKKIDGVKKKLILIIIIASIIIVIIIIY